MTGAAAVGCSSLPSGTSNPREDSPHKEPPVINWRMITSWPSHLSVYQRLVELCKRVEYMTAGRFVITPYEGGKIVEPLGKSFFDAVKNGESDIGEKVHCGHTALYYFTDIHPALAFGTTVPFGFNTQQQHAWLYRGIYGDSKEDTGDSGKDALQKILDKHNIVWFPAGNTTGQMGGWFSKPIESINDLKGLKMRIPGLGQRVLTRLGVEAVTLPAQDVVQALLERRIDAAEWIGPSEDQELGLHKVARYYYYPGWWEPGTSFAILVNQGEWEHLKSIDPKYQAIFEAAAMEANLKMIAQYNVDNGEALQDFISRGINIQRFSESFLKECRQEVLNFYEEMAEDNDEFPEFGSVYRNWKEFRNNLFDWYEISSFSFSKFTYEKVRESLEVKGQDETTDMCLPEENAIDKQTI